MTAIRVYMVKLLEGTNFAGMVVDGRALATVVLGVIVLGVVVRMLVVAEETLELGNAELTTVPFGYSQPHKTKPFGQEPTLCTLAPGGHVT